MNRELSERLLRIHSEYAREILKLVDLFSITGENSVLFQLLTSDREYLTSGEIKDSSGLTSGRTANVLSSLERKGRIIRERTDEDRRIVRVRLTEKGRKCIEQMYKECFRVHEDIVNAVGAEECEEIIDKFEKIMAVLKSCDYFGRKR